MEEVGSDRRWVVAKGGVLLLGERFASGAKAAGEGGIDGIGTPTSLVPTATPMTKRPTCFVIAAAVAAPLTPVEVVLEVGGRFLAATISAIF